MEHTFAVIMAGGGGTRLWPISRKNSPKQLLPLLGEETLYQSTVRRLEGLFPPERILVVTVAEQAEVMREQTPELPAENFLLEPAPRGTASVVGLAASMLQRRDPDAAMIILPSDHFIRNRDLFHYLVRAAVDVARKDYLVMLGIAPTYPATAYGYIQQGSPLEGQFNYPAYRVKRFTEKPEEKMAQQMLRGGDHSWNSGMFVWKTSTILTEIRQQMPELYTALEKIAAADAPELDSVIESVWPDLKNVTIDYGIMENATQVAVLPASGLGWSDVGSWDSIFDVVLPDMNGNIAIGGQHLAVETHNTLVFDNHNKRLVVTIGMDDVVVVETEDVLLVCKSDQSQKVKDVVEHLRKHRQETYL